MKTTYIDLEEIIKEKIKKDFNSPAIHITVIKGLNYDDFAILTKTPDDRYYWSNINAAYSCTSLGKESVWDDEWEALRAAFVAKKKIFQFENLQDLGKWLALPNKEKEGLNG